MTTPRDEEKVLVNKMAPGERRRSPRAKIAPSDIVYMNLPSGNGGVVLDVSSEGLGFQAADRVEVADSLSFRLSVPAIQHIEISGQVVWLDETRKRGGLRLNQLPMEVGSEIEVWRRKYLTAASVGERATEARAPAVQSDANSAKSRVTSEIAPPAGSQDRLSAPVLQRAPQAPVEIPAGSGAARAPFASAVGLGLDASARVSSPLVPPLALPTRMHLSEWRYGAPSGLGEWREKRSSLTIPLFVAFLLVAVAVGSLSFGTRQKAGELLIRLGEWISGEQSNTSGQGLVASAASTGTEAPTTTVLPAAPFEAPASSDSAVENADASGGPKSSATTPGQPGFDETDTLGGTSSADAAARAPGSVARLLPPQVDAKNIPEPTRSSSVTSTASDNGEMELTQAREYLQRMGREDSAEAAQLLWVAVGKGNIQAELELADLYLRGAGVVRKNCEQARVLLMAARKNNNPEAGERLAHLRDYGCR